MTALPEIRVGTEEDRIDAPHPDYDLQEISRAMPETLMGGTREMRKAGTKYLPQETAELDSEYQLRLERTFLMPAYRNTVRRITAMPFRESVRLEGEVPLQLQPIEANTDMAGRNLTQFSRQLFEDGLRYGLFHFYVDFSATGGTQDREDELRGIARPRFVRVSPRALFAWDDFETPAGEKRLSAGRWYEERIELAENSQYKKVRKQVIREWVQLPFPMADVGAGAEGGSGTKAATGVMRVWGKDPRTSKFTVEVETPRPTTWPGPGLPWVTGYFDRDGFMRGKPVFEDLAWINLQHWQKQSDLDESLRWVLAAILHHASPQNQKKSPNPNSQETTPQHIGPGTIVRDTDTDAKLSFVEHSGQGAEAGEKNLEKIEHRMEREGMTPLTAAANGRVVATGMILEQAKGESFAQMCVRALSLSLRDGYDKAGEWTGIEVPEDVQAQIFNDFTSGFGADQNSARIVELWKNGKMPDEEAVIELKRHGVFRDEMDVEAFVAKLKAQALEAAKMFMEPAGGDGEGEGGDGGAGGGGGGGADE